MTTTLKDKSVSTQSKAALSREDDDKFLSFTLGTETYGIEILKIREIMGIIEITPLPQMPAFVKGVINLRGKIIPVIEMRIRFGLDSIPNTEETCIIVVEVVEKTTGDLFQMGVIVDTVHEVQEIPAAQIEPAPAFGCAVSTDYVLGMGKVSDGVVILLDIDRVLSEGEMSTLHQAARREASTPAAGEKDQVAAT